MQISEGMNCPIHPLGIAPLRLYVCLLRLLQQRLSRRIKALDLSVTLPQPRTLRLQLRGSSLVCSTRCICCSLELRDLGSQACSRKAGAAGVYET